MGILQTIRGWFGLGSAPQPQPKRGYDAAGRGRRNKLWNAPSTSANTELEYSLRELRNRARDLCRNNPYAQRAVQAIANHVVGAGIIPTIVDERPNAERRIKKVWSEFAAKCDFDRGMSIYSLQKTMARAWAESGEVLIVRRRTSDPRAPLPFKLQVLEADYLDESKDMLLGDGGMIRMGVEFNAQGERVAYWLYDRHPGDAFNYRVSVRVPASEVIHIYEMLRPGQVRGVPRGASVMVRAKDLDEFEDAQLVRQKIAACYTAFVYKQDTNSIEEDIEDDRSERLGPGMIEYLEPGEQVTFGSPPAVQGYNEYVRRVLFAIAAGFGVTYEVIAQDLGNVNFSSGRMGWLEMSRNIQDWQQNLMLPAMNQIWEWFVEGAILTGKLKKPAFATWTMPRREMIDPRAETEAIILQIRNGLTSWEEAVQSLGWDAQELAAEIKKSYEMWDENGLVLDCDPRKPEGGPVQAPAEQPAQAAQEEADPPEE